MVYETIVNYGQKGSLCGIFTPALTPAREKASNGNPCIIFLNAGIIHKVGPNRIYQKLASGYAGNGFSTLRLDFSGLGDSGFTEETGAAANGKVTEVKMAMHWLQEHKGIDRFILSGMCTGAVAALETSLADPRVIGLCLIDGIYTDDQQVKCLGWKQLKARQFKKYLFRWGKWMKLLSGESKLITGKNFRAGVLLVIARLKRKRVRREKVNPVPDSPTPWEILFGRNVKIQMVFCEGNDAIDIYNISLSRQLARYRTTGMLQTAFVRGVDHTFTPLWSQKHLSDLTTAWLKKEFER